MNNEEPEHAYPQSQETDVGPPAQGERSPKVLEVDLHGYSTWEALELADKKVQEAWEKQYDYIMLIHGAPDVTHHFHVKILQRGSIKWGLRGRLYRGEWMEYVYCRRSTKHSIYDGSMRLALRPKMEERTVDQ